MRHEQVFDLRVGRLPELDRAQIAKSASRASGLFSYPLFGHSSVSSFDRDPARSSSRIR